MTDDKLAAALAEIREHRQLAIEGIAPGTIGPADPVLQCRALANLADVDVPRLLAAVDAALNLHGSVPWYCAASDCGHPEPPEDDDGHDDWYDDHTSGTGGITVCLLTQVDSICPECTRLKYDTLDPEGDDFVSAPCGTRLAILKAITGKAADDG